MFIAVDEYALGKLSATGGVYAFHLRAIRRVSVGLTGREPFDDEQLAAAKRKCMLIADRILKLERLHQYRGSLAEVGAYEGHGAQLDLCANRAYTDYLFRTIDAIHPSDIPGFVRTAETLCTFLPPLYVGIALKQSVQARYDQHKSDFANRRPNTFGGRFASIGFAWNDVAFSFSPHTTLRMKDESIRRLENYIHFFLRPRLGRR